MIDEHSGEKLPQANDALAGGKKTVPPIAVDAPAGDAKPARPIAVVGEIPFAGRAVIQALAAKGRVVRVLCPDEAQANTLIAEQPAAVVSVVRGDLGSRQALDELLRHSEAVCFVSPFNMNGRIYRLDQHLTDIRVLIEAAQEAAVEKIVYHSVLGAAGNGASKTVRDAYEAECHLEAAKLETFRLRTGPLMGPGDDFLTRAARKAEAPAPFTGMLGYGSTQLQPLHVSDFGRCVANLLSDRSNRPGVYQLAVSEIRTWLDIVDDALTAKRRAKLKLHAPIFALRIYSGLSANARLAEKTAVLQDYFVATQNDSKSLLGPGEELHSLAETEAELFR